MATAFDPAVHEIITDANDKPVPQKYDPEANSGAGGFVEINVDDVQEINTNDIETLIGEVQETPTANTVLARLKKLQASSNLDQGSVTVGTTEVELIVGASKLSGRNKVNIKCIGDDAIYVGATGVTTSNGYPILPGEGKTFKTEADLYAIADTEQEARIIEEAI